MSSRFLRFVVCVIVLAAMFYVFTAITNSDSDSDVVINGFPTGIIYTSMSADDGPVSVHRAELLLGGLSIEPFYQVEGLTTMQVETAAISTGYPDMFYVMAPESGSSMQVSSNIAHLRTNTGELELLLASANNLVRERDLDFSVAANQLAFSAQTIQSAQVTDNTGEEIESVGVWGVYLYDLGSGELDYVAPGKDPQWSPNGEYLVYLGTDGLYQYTLATQEVVPVVMPEGVTMDAGENINIDISETGTEFALASPNDYALYLGSFTFGPESVLGDLRQHYPENAITAYFWPTFDPGGEYLAIQTAQAFGSTELSNPELSIINVQTGAVEATTSLSSYDFDRAFIDEWDYR